MAILQHWHHQETWIWKWNKSSLRSYKTVENFKLPDGLNEPFCLLKSWDGFFLFSNISLCQLFSAKNIILCYIYFHLDHQAVSLKYMILRMEKLKQGWLDYILLEFLTVHLFLMIFILINFLILLEFLRHLDSTIYPRLFSESLLHIIEDRFNILFIIIYFKFHPLIFFLLIFYYI